MIAEAGVNHNGQIELAYKLVDAAAEAGADVVKFQTFKAAKISSRSAVKADYQRKQTGSSESQYEMLKKLELSNEAHEKLVKYCETKKSILCQQHLTMKVLGFLLQILSYRF